MKKKYNITFDDISELMIVKPNTELILENVPKGKTTSATIIADVFGINRRTSLKYLVALEKAGYFSSKFHPVKYKNSTCITRVFTRV